jgi:hypothetical protein
VLIEIEIHVYIDIDIDIDVDVDASFGEWYNMIRYNTDNFYFC